MFKKGTKVLITAGPTYERIDPVRFIGNFSTGKMGIEIAYSLYKMGCEVTLILGPTHLQVEEFINVIRVESCEEMFISCMNYFKESDVIVCSAAVADFKPINIADNKIKKTNDNNNISIELTKTIDILSTMGKIKTKEQFLVGFALETKDVLDYARKKLVSKNADMIVMNIPSKNTGFATDTNKVTLITKNLEESTDILSKKEIANIISDKIYTMYK